MMTALAIILVIMFLFPGEAAEWYARFELALPGAREKIRAAHRKKEVRRRAKNIKRIRDRKFREVKA